MEETISAGEVRVRHFRGRPGLDLLQDSWQEILAQKERKHFFHLWEWYDCYLKCLAPNPASVNFFLFSREGKPVAVFPLQETNFNLGGVPLAAWSLAIHNHLLLGDVICQDEACRWPLFGELAHYLKNLNMSWDLLLLPHLLPDSSLLKILQVSPPPRYLLRLEGQCDYIRTQGKTYEEYNAELSKNFRRSLKRAAKYLNEELKGTPRFFFTSDGPELEEKLDFLFEVEASGWKGASGSGSAIKLKPELACFYRELTRSLRDSGNVLINTLELEGKCLAAQFCLLVEETAYMLKIGYDEQYGRYAPGKLLTEQFIKRCLGNPEIKSINYITDASWHADWAPETYEKSICYVFNASPKGLLAYSFMKIYGAYIKPRLPGWLQKKISPEIGTKDG